MIIANVCSPIYIPQGSEIIGRSDNSGLPDYAMFAELDRLSKELNSYIGYNYLYTGQHLRKVYAVWGGVLYEYTLSVTNLQIGDEIKTFYVPISVKPYTNGFKTYLYLNGVLASIRDQENANLGEAMSLTAMMSEMLKDCETQEMFFLHQKVKASGYDFFISPELPAEVSNLLFELGNMCLSYGSSAAAYLYFNYGEELGNLGKIYAFNNPSDIISAYGCSASPYISVDKFNSITDAGSCAFFDMLAQSQTSTLTGLQSNARYLDKHCHIYDDAGIEGLLDCIYSECCTDIVGDVTETSEIWDGYTLTNKEPVQMTTVPMYTNVLRSHIRTYNLNHGEDPITSLHISKTWTDQFYLYESYRSGRVDSWYINLALFHLYSPSIIRVKLANDINSLRK